MTPQQKHSNRGMNAHCDAATPSACMRSARPPSSMPLSLCLLLLLASLLLPVVSAQDTMGFSAIPFVNCYPGQRFGIEVTPPGPVSGDLTFTPSSTNPDVTVACDPSAGCPSWLSGDSTARHYSVIVSSTAFSAGSFASFDLAGSFTGAGAATFNAVTPASYSLFVLAPPVTLSQHGGGQRNVVGSFNYQNGGPRVGNSLTDKITFGQIWGLAAISCCSAYPIIFTADNSAGAITRIRKNATQYGDDVDQPWTVSAPRFVAAHCDTSGGCASRSATLYVGDVSCAIWKIDVYADPVTAPVMWLGQLGCNGGTFNPGTGIVDVTTQQLPGEVRQASVSPDGAWLALNSADHLYLVDTVTGLITPVISGTSTWGALCLTNDYLYYWSSGPRQLRRLLLSDQVTDELILSIGSDVNGIVVDTVRGRVLFTFLNYLAMHLLTDSTTTYSILAGHEHTGAEEADGMDTDVYSVSGWLDGVGTKSVLGSPSLVAFNAVDNEVYFATAVASDAGYSDETQGLRKLSGGDFSTATYPVAAEVSPLIPYYGVCSYLAGRGYGFGRSWTSVGMSDWLVPMAGVSGRPPVLYTSEHVGQNAIKRINKVNLDTSEYTQNTWTDSGFRSSTRQDPLNTARAASQTLFSCDTIHDNAPQISSYDQPTNTNVRFTFQTRSGQSEPNTPTRAQFDDSTDTLYWFEANPHTRVGCAFLSVPYADFVLVNRTAIRLIAAVDTCDTDMGNPFYMFEADFAIDQVNQAIYSVKHMWANGAVFRTPRILKIDIATGTMTNLFVTDWTGRETPGNSNAMLDDGAEGQGATIWQPDRITVTADGTKAYITDGAEGSWRIIREIDLQASPRTIRTIYGSRTSTQNYLACLDGAGAFGGLNWRSQLALDPRNNGLLYLGLKNKVRTLVIGTTLAVVSAVSPEKVTVGASATVTITGANFDSGFTAVWWNDLSQVPVARVPCASANWVDDTRIICNSHAFTSYGNWVPSVVQPSGESQLYGVFVEVAPLGSITSVSQPYVLAGGAQTVLLNHTGSQPGTVGGIQYYSISGTTVASTACTSVAVLSISQLSCTLNNLPVQAVVQYRVLDGSGNSVMSIASSATSTGYNQTYFSYNYPTSVQPGAVWGAFVDPSSNAVKKPTHLRFTPSFNLSGVVFAPLGPGTTYIDFDNTVAPKRMAIRFPSTTSSGRYTATATVADETNSPTNFDALMYRPPAEQTFDLTALRMPDSLSIHGGNTGLGNGLHPDGLDGTAGVSDLSWGTVGSAALGGTFNDSVLSIDMRNWNPTSPSRQYRLFNRTTGVMKGWVGSGLSGTPSFWALSPLAPNTVLMGTSTCRIQKIVWTSSTVAITSVFTGTCTTSVFRDNSWTGGAIHAADPNLIFVIQFGVVYSAHITTLALVQWTGSIATQGPLATAANSVYFFSNGQIFELDLLTNTTQPIAGQAGVVDHLDGAFGSNAFDTPVSLAVNAANTVLYVSTSCAIRRVDLVTKMVTTLAGAFHRPDTFDSASYPHCGILEGVGSAARLSQPWPLMLDELTNKLLFSEVSGLFKVRVGMRQLDLSTNAVTNLVSNQPSCSFPEGSVDGVGSAWSSSGPTSIRFLPATATRNAQIFGAEFAGLLGARRDFFAVDLLSGRKSQSRPFSGSFFSTIAGAATSSNFFVGAVTIANTDVYFFATYGTLYSADSAGVESSMPTPLFTVKSVRYDAATAKLVMYQQATAALLNQGNCSFWQIPYTSYLAGGATALAAYQVVAQDSTCASGGDTSAFTHNEWIYESDFVVSSAGSMAYAIPYQNPGRTRLRVLNLQTGALSNLFYSDWPSMGATYSNFVNTATWWLSDGYSEAGATVGTPSSIAIDSTNSFLYIADAPNGIAPVAVRAINTIRRIDIANKRIDTLAGKYPWTTYRDLCSNASPASSQLFRPVNLQMAGAFNSIALDTRNDGVLYVISGTRIRTVTVLNLPLVTAISPATALLGASASTVTLFGVNFGSAAGQLTDVKFGATGTEMTIASPAWMSASQIVVLVPAGLATGSYVFTIQTSNGARGLPSAPFVYTVGGLAGSLTTVTPASAYAGENVQLNSTSFGSNVARVSLLGTVLGQPARFNCSAIALTTPTSIRCTLPLSLSTVAAGTVFTFQAYSALDIPLQNATASPTLTLMMTPVSSSSSSSGVAQSSSSTGAAASSSSSSTGVVSGAVVEVVESPEDDGYYNEETAAADNAALKPESTATTVVTASGVVLNVTDEATGAKINPCNTDLNPCLYGSSCVFTPFVNNTQTGIVTNASLSCTCIDGFFGPQCNIAVLKCHNCVSSLSGGSNITLLGLNLDYITGMRIAGNVVPFSRGYVDRDSATTLGDVARAALNLPWPASVRAIQVLSFMSFMSFVAPSTIVRSADGNSTYSWADLHSSSSTGAQDSTGVGMEDSSSSTADGTAAARRLLAVDDSTVNTTITTSHVSSDISIVLPNRFKFAYTLNSLIYYTKSVCISEGQWKEDGAGGCLACPAGGCCPGGGRAWPTAQYWSYNENATPQKCPLALQGACPGVVCDSAFASQKISTGAKNTQICEVGYAGTACSLCDTGYYMSENRCWSCGSTESQQAYFSLMLLVGFGIVCGLSLAVAVLKAKMLAKVVTFFMILQQAVQVGKSGSSSLPDSTQFVAEFFNSASIINFDVEFVKPGCTGPAITFMQLFWFTVLLAAVTGVMFFVACLLRRIFNTKRASREDALERAKSLDRVRSMANLRKTSGQVEADRIALERLATEARLDEERKAKELASKMFVPPRVDFFRRLVHSFLILLSLYYLKLTTLCVRGVICSYAPDPSPLDGSYTVTTESLYLNVDSSIRCYKGYHRATVVFIFFFFLFYCVGFPVFCFVVLTRAFITPEHGGIMGWLVRHFKVFQSRSQQLSDKKARALKRQLTLEASESAKATAVARQLSSPMPNASGASVWDVDSSAAAVVNSKANAKRLALEQQLVKHAILQRTRMDMFGFLFMQLRTMPDNCTGEDYPLFRIFTSFPVSMIYALSTNLSEDTQVQLFVLGLVSCCSFMAVLVQQPFVSRFDNRKMALIYSATLAHVVVTMGATYESARDGSRKYFYILIGMWCVLTLWIFIRKCCGCLARLIDTDDDRFAAGAEAEVQVFGAGEDEIELEPLPNDKQKHLAAMQVPADDTVTPVLAMPTSPSTIDPRTMRIQIDKQASRASQAAAVASSNSGRMPMSMDESEEPEGSGQIMHLKIVPQGSNDPAALASPSGAADSNVLPLSPSDGVGASPGAHHLGPRSNSQPSGGGGRGSNRASPQLGPRTFSDDGRAAPSQVSINGESHIIASRHMPGPLRVSPSPGRMLLAPQPDQQDGQCSLPGSQEVSPHLTPKDGGTPSEGGADAPVRFHARADSDAVASSPEPQQPLSAGRAGDASERVRRGSHSALRLTPLPNGSNSSRRGSKVYQLPLASSAGSGASSAESMHKYAPATSSIITPASRRNSAQGEALVGAAAAPVPVGAARPTSAGSRRGSGEAMALAGGVSPSLPPRSVARGARLSGINLLNAAPAPAASSPSAASAAAPSDGAASSVASVSSPVEAFSPSPNSRPPSRSGEEQ